MDNKSLTITLNSLSIGYKSHGDNRIVASEINERLEPGVLNCLIGCNGVGKSTLLRTIAAFQPKISGEIMIGEKEIDSLSTKQKARLISIVLTDKPDTPNLTVRQLVALGRSPYTNFWGKCSDEDWQIVEQSLQMAGSTVDSHRLMDRLSDGERQRIMIAKALAQQTPVILLDEPTAFLDYPSKIEIMTTLRQICHKMKKTILLSTHDFELVLQLADRLWLMERNGKFYTGSPRELAENGSLSNFIDRENTRFDPQTMRVITSSHLVQPEGQAHC